MDQRNDDQKRGSSSEQSSSEQSSGTGRGTLAPYAQRNSLSGTGSPFALVRRMMSDFDRFFGGSSLFSTMDDLFERSLDAPSLGQSFWSPSVDVFERGQELVVHAELPGLRQEDLNVSVDRGVLTISGQRTQEQSSQDEQRKIHRRERSFGSFQRSLVLPEGTDINNVRASFENGVLEVIAPLPDRAQKRGRQVPISPKTSGTESSSTANANANANANPGSSSNPGGSSSNPGSDGGQSATV